MQLPIPSKTEILFLFIIFAVVVIAGWELAQWLWSVTSIEIQYRG